MRGLHSLPVEVKVHKLPLGVLRKIYYLFQHFNPEVVRVYRYLPPWYQRHRYVIRYQTHLADRWWGTSRSAGDWITLEELKAGIDWTKVRPIIEDEPYTYERNERGANA